MFPIKGTQGCKIVSYKFPINKRPDLIRLYESMAIGVGYVVKLGDEALYNLLCHHGLITRRLIHKKVETPVWEYLRKN